MNDLFLSCVGYTREAIVGKHHSIFCDRGYVQSPRYQQFWDDLKWVSISAVRLSV